MVDLINSFARRVPVWAIWLICLLPVPVLLYQGVTGGLGREPISALEHELGELALKLLIIGLCITPMRRFLKINLLRFRRAIGLLSFTYVVLHLLVWAVLDVQIVSQIWTDILKRPYITVGMGSLLLLLPLAVTSNQRLIRRMGASAWQKLHMLVYPAVFLGGIHFVMVQKVWELESLIYVTVIAALISLRFRWRRQATRTLA
ncbi:MAG: protein-methionine-sulfoxide reductase heme-binding subunit MsrQ [Aliishimia sp.]